MADQYTLIFTQQELLALEACYAVACLGPMAPGIDPALTDAAGNAQAKIQGALWNNR